MAETVTIEKYDNGADQTGFRYQMDISINNADPARVKAMPSNPYADMIWRSVGDDIWRGRSLIKTCESWVIDKKHIGIQCYAETPF